MHATKGTHIVVCIDMYCPHIRACFQSENQGTCCDKYLSMYWYSLVCIRKYWLVLEHRVQTLWGSILMFWYGLCTYWDLSNAIHVALKIEAHTVIVIWAHIISIYWYVWASISLYWKTHQMPTSLLQGRTQAKPHFKFEYHLLESSISLGHWSSSTSCSLDFGRKAGQGSAACWLSVHSPHDEPNLQCWLTSSLSVMNLKVHSAQGTAAGVGPAANLLQVWLLLYLLVGKPDLLCWLDIQWRPSLGDEGWKQLTAVLN